MECWVLHIQINSSEHGEDWKDNKYSVWCSEQDAEKAFVNWLVKDNYAINNPNDPIKIIAGHLLNANNFSDIIGLVNEYSGLTKFSKYKVKCFIEKTEITSVFE